MDRYTRRLSDGEVVCATCGSLVSNPLAHDLFHDRFNLMYDAIPVSGESITATDWQAAHDAGEDEELFPGAARTCALCGHRGRLLGGSATEPGRPTVHLCHGCGEEHDCYHRWTVYGVRPHTDDCRDLYCGGCEEVDAPHEDPCDCDECRWTAQRNAAVEHTDDCHDLYCGGCEVDTEDDHLLADQADMARCSVCSGVGMHAAGCWVGQEQPEQSAAMSQGVMVGGLITEGGPGNHFVPDPPVSNIETSGHDDACRCGDCLCTYRPGEPHEDPCDCDDCRAQPTLHRHPDTPTDEPAVGSVARCTGCGNVYVRKASGWVDTDDMRWGREWADIAHSFCGPVKVIYGPGEDE